jgi:RND family efflux transporter MFP subunit
MHRILLIVPISRRATRPAGCAFAAALMVFLFLLTPLGAVETEVTGFTEPRHQVEVASPESGLLRNIAVEEGQHVQKGQLLAALDNEVLEASLALAQAKAGATAPVDAAAAQYAMRQKRAEALEVLYRQGNANVEEVERARTEAAVAKANLETARKELQLSALEATRIEAEIRRRLIRSPIDGVVVELTRKPGEFLSTSEPTLARVANLDALLVKFYVPMPMAQEYRTGQRVHVLFLHGQQLAEGRVDFVSPVTDADSGTVRIDVVIDNKRRNYRSGVRCRLSPPQSHGRQASRASLRFAKE